jgi:hypothetical protein
METSDAANSFTGVTYVTESLKRVKATEGNDAACRLALEIATASVLVLALQSGKERAINVLNSIMQQVEML